MKILIAAAAATLAFVLPAGTALADPSGPDFRDPPSSQNANPVGTSSSAATHNGQNYTLGEGGDPSHGTRGDEIKATLQSGHGGPK